MLPGPLPSTPPRRVGSVRRTSHVRFTNRPFSGGLPTVFGATGVARDLHTGAGGADVLGSARIDVTTGDANVIESVTTTPAHADVDALVGHRIGFGFGSAARDVLRPLGGSLLGRLLSDLDGGWAPAAWGASRESMRLVLPVPEGGGVHMGTPPDTCAGWRADGAPMRLRLAGERPPFIDEPDLAPDLASDDPLAWHDLEPLAVGQARRLRRLDVVAADGGIEVDAHFRDSAVLPDGTERIVHEYTVTATVETEGWTFTSAVAEPRVLPFPSDCAIAADSASLLVGRTVDSLRAGIGPQGRGAGACTHLTDLLRTLADVDRLAPLAYEAGSSIR